MNSFAESFIGRSPAGSHFKVECLNHFVCFSLDQLDYIVSNFQHYHNQMRPHQGKGVNNRILDADWQPPPPVGAVKRQKILSGLLNQYYRDTG